MSDTNKALDPAQILTLCKVLQERVDDLESRLDTLETRYNCHTHGYDRDDNTESYDGSYSHNTGSPNGR